MNDASSESTANSGSGSLRRAQWVAAVLVLALVVMAAWVLRGGSSTAGPVIAQAEGRCLAPPEQMRRSHPDLLRHQRDLTVHEGQRGASASLEACVNCHATPVSQAPGAVRTVLGEGQFCQSCHSYAAVKLDCFECHSSRPSGPGHTTNPLTLRLTPRGMGPGGSGTGSLAAAEPRRLTAQAESSAQEVTR